MLVHLGLEAVRVFEDERATERFVGDAARKGCEADDCFDRPSGSLNSALRPDLRVARRRRRVSV